MTPRLLTLFTLVIGLGLFSYALALPYYSDQQAADDLTGNAYNLEKQDYYKKEAALRTDKVTFMDLGSGLAIASVTLLGYFIFTKVRTFKDLSNNRTLAKPPLSFLPTWYGFFFCREPTGITCSAADGATIRLSRTVLGFGS